MTINKMKLIEQRSETHMKNYKELMDTWSEVMYERLTQAQTQIMEASRADYHKGYAEGVSAGISYAMAIMHRTERQLNAKVVNEAIEKAPEVIQMAPVMPHSSIPANVAEPGIKRVIAWKCGGCGDSAIVFQNPEQTVLCSKCGHNHKFKELHKASYFCDCGKICKFMMEAGVTEVVCHCCKKKHRMAFSDINGDYYSLDNRDRQGYTPKAKPAVNAGGTSKAQGKPQEKPKHVHTVEEQRSSKFVRTPFKGVMYDNRCLICGKAFKSDRDGEALCPDCTGGNK